MTDTTRVVIGRTMASIAIVSAVVGIVWALAIGETEYLWSNWVIHNAIVAVGSGLIAWLVVPSQPRNALIWVFAWAGLCTGLLALGYAITVNMLANLGLETPVFELVPAELPTSLALVVMNVNWLWMPLFLIFTLGLALFPDGRPPSPRWRWLPLLVLVLLSLTVVGLFWEARPWATFPIAETQDTHGGFRSLTAAMVTIGYIGTALTIPFCMAALVVRFRRSRGAERQQFRWVVWGATVAAVFVFGALVVDEGLGLTNLTLLLGVVGMCVLLTSFGIAIGKYRLYDIDIVISRTLVYGLLAVFIAAVYIGIVVGVGYLAGGGDEPNTWLGLVATVVIAIAFQPLRRQLERLANRVVYGRRATPYEVLSSFSQRVSAVDPAVLNQIARSLAEGTTATSASIWLYRDGVAEAIAVWTEDGADPPEGPGADRSSPAAPVIHDGEELGRVVLRLPPGQPFPASDGKLLEQVSSGLGLALRNFLLTTDLRTRVDELRASRRRIVAVQDETRRKLERDLHDGAQQRLVALKIKLGIGSAMAGKQGLGDVQSLIDAIKSETDQTIETVRDFARGIYPPLLEAEGLGAALNAQARKMSIPVSVQAAGLSRYPKEQEATIYFCVLEALQNAMKHANATSVQVVVTDKDGLLGVEIRDDGDGFDSSAIGGSGLVNMADRIEAVGGSFHVDSEPGRGTRVSARVPVLEGAIS